MKKLAREIAFFLFDSNSKTNKSKKTATQRKNRNRRTSEESVHERHRPSETGDGAKGRSPAALAKSPERSEGEISEAAPDYRCGHRLEHAIMNKASKPKVRLAEIAGRTLAGCVSIFCCCPCGLFNLVILAAFKLPAGLCRRAFRKRLIIRQARKKAAIRESGSRTGCGGSYDTEYSASEMDYVADHPGMKVVMVVDSWPVRSPTAEIVEMDKEMWSKFCDSGFWRSLSQRISWSDNVQLTAIANGAVTEMQK